MWVYTYSTHLNNAKYYNNSQFSWEFNSKSHKKLNFTHQQVYLPTGFCFCSTYQEEEVYEEIDERFEKGGKHNTRNEYDIYISCIRYIRRGRGKC